MLDQILQPPALPFVKTAKSSVPIYLVRANELDVQRKRRGDDAVIVGLSETNAIYDTAAIASGLGLRGQNSVFAFETGDLPSDLIDAACLGWALAGYRFDLFKSEKAAGPPSLVWPKNADRARVTAMAEGICLARNLINTPANILGPAELEQAARAVATRGGAKIKIIGGEKLEKEFPLIHAVGVSSPRAPRLIDFTWGDAKHSKITLVGKGVCFDTGGLDLKPGPHMLLMRKDMGGAAHVLGLAHIIMALGLKIRLHVLIPAVENAVSGTSFRPGDILSSRKGLSVENLNTDAEGRLILADALTLACEETPDLLIDCATLTGSARAGLGYDIPAVFSNREELAHALKDVGMAAGDPLWPLPLWQGYKKEMASDVADLNNTGTSPAGAITAALFLEYFVTPQTPWLHIDMYAWEQSGKPGRPRGGADTGLRALLAFIEQQI